VPITIVQSPSAPVPPSLAAVPAASVIRQIDQYRYLWFAVVALFLLCSFNGQWQIGPDSAAFRQIGHQLATTGRYYFRDDVPGLSEYHNKQGTIYPGLPLVLAGLEKLFGTGPLAPLVLMQVMAAITLVLTYRLMLYRLPRWAAVCVVVGVGTNPRFLQYANEILSDIPFLLGVILTLLGYEWVVRANTSNRILKGLGLVALGLILSAAMRVTYLFVAVALITACALSLLIGRDGLSARSSAFVAAPRNRSRFVWLILMAAACAGIFKYGLDIRSKHSNGFISGGYESRLADQVGDFNHKLLPRLPVNCAQLLENVLPMAFLGYRSDLALIPIGEKNHLGIGTVISLLVIAGGALLVRRNTFWGLFVISTVVSLAIMGPVPRYFLMILPLLLAGWGLLCYRLACRFNTATGSNLALRLGLGFVLVLNIAASVDFILTQRGFARLVDEHHHWQGLKHVGFLRAYHFGHWSGIYDLARFASREIGPDEKVLGPEPTILTYLSGRQIYPPHKDVVAKDVGTIFKRAFFHVEKAGGGVPEYDDPMADYVSHGRLREGEIEAGPVAGYRLSKLEVAPAPAK
jgi:hypothetical protein